MTIDLMARFRWELKSSTPVRTKDSHLEQRGGELWSVTETEEYIHLVFERDLDTPNLAQIKALEAEFHSIRLPTMPGLTWPIIAIIAGFLSAGAGIGVLLLIAGVAWLVANLLTRPKVAAQIRALKSRQVEILEECDRL